MLPDAVKEKLQNIIRGELEEGQADSCSTIRNLLCRSFGTGPTIKREFESRAIIKEKQAGFLKSYAQKESLWLEKLPSGSRYLTRGGESMVYLAADDRHVIKTNDAGYYATWEEYFSNLVIHNLLFPDTAYSIIGFTETEEKLFSVLQQPFAKGGQASLEDIEDLLNFNGFTKVRRQDYYHKELGLALEDMHDENVILCGDTLFFIDTVFYIMEKNSSSF
jgi:hypothetical protein